MPSQPLQRPVVWMFSGARSSLLTTLLGVAFITSACAPVDPEIIAIEYLRATRTGESDDAIAWLDMDGIVERVSNEIVMVNTAGDPDQFLKDSVRTLLWGLFQETPRQDELTYDATPADIDGERATVQVTLTGPEGQARARTVHLRRTDDGWRVSGRSIDDLVTYSIQRLEERF